MTKKWEPTCTGSEPRPATSADAQPGTNGSRNGFKAIDSKFEIISAISRDGGIRTRGLLLPNQLHPAAGRGLMSPGVAFTWDDAGWTSPGVAWCLCTLAPTLAPAPRAAESRISACRTEHRTPRQASAIFGAQCGDLRTSPCRGTAAAAGVAGFPADRGRLPGSRASDWHEPGASRKFDPSLKWVISSIYAC